jgi:UDP-GlcNAc:undecaprenyl-phosphate GlcNAc-1-phosphate transferase
MSGSVLVALAASLLLQPLVIRLLRRHEVLDVPNERSSHSAPTPRGGGIAVVAAIAAGTLVGPRTPAATVVFAGVLGCALLGLVEDVYGVSMRRRLAVQGLVGALVVAALATISTTAGTAVSSGAGSAALAVSLLCGAGYGVGYVAVVNAVNFMDGINGISAATAVAGGSAYALLGIAVGEPCLILVGAVTAAAMLAFAPFNAPRARVFLGDTGSYGLGAALAGLALVALHAGLPLEAALGPLAVYLADTGTALTRRMLAGEAWYLPHRTHVYQRLVRSGYGHGRVSIGVGTLIASTSALGAVSLLSHAFARATADAALVALVAGYVVSPTLLAKRKAPAV